MKRTLYLLAAGLMVSVIIIGCSTEDPYVVDAENPLVMAMVSAPDATTAVASNSSVSFSWSATGGSGEMAGYRWYLDPMETGYNTATNVTNVTYENVPGDAADPTDYTFRVIGTDSDGDADTIVAAFIVSATVDPDPDVTAPDVTITSGPAEGSYVATGTSIAFSWTGDDGGGNDDMIEYQYAFPTVGDVSDWGPATSASFNEVAAVDPAEFRVRGRDQDDNTSDWVLVSFVIQDATILYIDDYLFTDADGNNDMPKERDQKQFYRNALAGYAFAEWDNDVQGVPVLADLAGIEVIVWCADSEIGTADGNYRLWYDIGAEGGGVLKEFMDGGGKLLLTGTQTLGYMYDSNPPASDAFESEYLGVSDSLIIDVVDTTWWLDDVAHDTLIVTPDSVTADTSYEETWFNEWWLTWVMKDSETTLDLPDSMKIDVAKQGDQDDYCSGMTFLRNDATVTTEPIFRWGLWVDGSAPAAPYYESIIGHITSWSGEPVSAMLNFDTYSMPPDGIRQTFVTILTEFGQ